MTRLVADSISRIDFAHSLLDAPRRPRLTQFGTQRKVLEQCVEEASNLLRSAGIAAGDRVLVKLADPPAFVDALVSIWLLDASPVIIDPRLSDTATTEVVSTVKPSFSFEEAGVVRAPMEADSGAPSTELMIQLTSGTTGRFRLVRRDVSSVRTEVERYQQMGYLGSGTSEVILGSSPFHTFGLVGAILSGLAAGKDVSFARQMTANELGVPDQRGRALVTVPTALHHLVEYRAGAYLSSLEAVLFAGERLTAEMAARLAAVANSPVNIFGTTETGLLAQSQIAETLRWFSTSGVRELDTSSGALAVRMQHSPYLSQEDPRCIDGWFRTVDIVNDDGSDRFTVLGRVDSQVSIAGRKVNLSRVEEAAIGTGMCIAAFSTRIELYVELAEGASSTAFRDALTGSLETVELPSQVLCIPRFPRTFGGKTIRDAPVLRALARAHHEAR
ncbi:hypothetical protein ATY41_10290 [Leifsonia xyli subsp. xyli]|nr:hypothetical protein ATY41_10290 [Leifsonia xyli subsp. xyli]